VNLDNLPNPIRYTIASIIGIPIIAIILIVICVIYFVVPMYIAQHPKFGHWFKFEIAILVYALMWATVLWDGYNAVRTFYRLPQDLTRKDGAPKKNRQTFPISSMFFSYLYSIYSFSVAYVYISHEWPHSFGHHASLSVIDSIYFSVVTATSIGYGDITPKTDLAKLVVIAQALCSLGYVIFLFSICSTHLRDRPTNH
jgi:hypothetical protein